MALRRAHGVGKLAADEDFLEMVDVVLRGPRVIRERIDHFQKWNDFEFRQRFRLSIDVVRYIINKTAAEIASKTNRNNALSPTDMMLLTLRFLATGSLFTIVGELSGVDKVTASRCITTVIDVIARLRPEYIEMPTTNEEIIRVRQGFYNIAKFPKCVGALDCTHVRVQSPGRNDAERFRNRRGFFSYNVQAVCDSKLIIRYIACRWSGSTHDSTIFNNSLLKANLEIESFGAGSLVVGDSGYGNTNYLITPLGNPRTSAENLLNEAQIRTRNPFERCFGALKRRFLYLAHGIWLQT